MKKPFSPLDRNALLWKDTTQWLNCGGFLVLFFGLLALAEGISLIMYCSSPPGEAGHDIFIALEVLLGIYMVAVAAFGAWGARTDVSLRSFELTVLSGIRSQQVVWGKLLALCIQFLLGMAALAPFMLCTYLMGGKDLLQLLGSLLSFWFVALPLFMMALIHGYKLPGVGIAVWIARFFYLIFIFILLNVLLLLISPFLDKIIENGLGYYIKGIVELNVPIIFGWAVALSIYFFGCSVLFAIGVMKIEGAVPSLGFPSVNLYLPVRTGVVYEHEHKHD